MHSLISGYITFIVAMIAILNPIGNAAIYLGLVANQSIPEQHTTATRTAIAVGIILIITIWIGMPVLKFFGISLSAFEAAGGLIVLLIGLSMTRAQPHQPEYHTQIESSAHPEKSDISVVPLAIPIIAGPGAMATVIAHAYQFTNWGNKLVESLICLALALLIALCLYFAPLLRTLLGRRGMKITTRIMGLIIIAIAMQMLVPAIHALM